MKNKRGEEGVSRFFGDSADMILVIVLLFIVLGFVGYIVWPYMGNLGKSLSNLFHFGRN